MQMMHLKAIRCEIWQKIMRTAESFIRLTLTFPSQLSHKKDFSAFTLEKYTFIGSLKLTGGSGPPALRLGTAGAPPRFVSVICRGDIPTLKKKKRRGKLWREQEWESEMAEAGGASAERWGCQRVGGWFKEGPWGRVERSLARQESDSLLIGSIGHCQLRIFSRSLTGRVVRMIAHLSAQNTNKNKPLLI